MRSLRRLAIDALFPTAAGGRIHSYNVLKAISHSYHYEKAGIFASRLHLSSLDSIRISIWFFGSIFSAANYNCYATWVKEVLIKYLLDRWQTAVSGKLF